MGNFSDKDMGWNKLVTVFEAQKGEEAVIVGFNRSSGEYLQGNKVVTVAQIAAIHEFGSSDGSIPERSFMRTAMDENSDNIKKTIDGLALQVLEKKIDRTKALGILGEYVKALFQKRIRSGPFKANTPSTIAAKGGKNKPLIDTGQMINSVEWEIVKGKK